MNRTIATLIALTACGLAHAQSASPTPNPTGVAAGTPAQGSGMGINPFTGRARSLEDLQRQLETKKLETALLEEAVRNAGLQADLENVGKRKQAEMAPALTQIARESSQREKLERELRQERDQEKQEREAAAKRRADEERDRKAASKHAKSATTPASLQGGDSPAPVAPRLEALSISVSSTGASALVNMGGAVTSVEQGQNTPYGRVRIEQDAVYMGNQKLTVHAATLGRVVLSETAAQPLGAGQGAVGKVTTVIGGQPQAQRQPSVLPPPVPSPQTRAGSGMPALQLPAGATLVNSEN